LGQASSSGMATVVFTDLVGSTALRAVLGEERAEALRRAHDRTLKDVAGGGGGMVIKAGS
jgi:class 3 adenylate cyclase